MSSLRKHIRLLPAVIGVGALLLALKGEGLVRQAWAQEQTAPPGAAAVLAQDTAPLSKDGADDNETSSVAEVDVLSSLAKRRAALDAREAEINARADLLAAAESRVDGKITTLQQLQDKITTLLGQRDSEQEKQIATLVKTYSAMKPKDAARIFDNLSDDVLIPVAQAMKPDILAPILAAMTADAAQKLTLKLANRLKLPDPAPAPVATAAAPAAPGPAAPAASQQASAASPGATGSP
jgi:flagellar motility protein MotE (MotC chaperone)